MSIAEHVQELPPVAVWVVPSAQLPLHEPARRIEPARVSSPGPSLPERSLPEPSVCEPLSLLDQLAEDFATYDRKLTQPGLWAVIAHRLGASAALRPRGLERSLLEAAHRALAGAADLVWGIQLPREVRLGRRVRIWHSGCIVLNAREIGDDVQLRHGTTIGPLRGMSPASEQLPVIEARVELGAGATVLGDVRVGHDSFVGANSLVIKTVSPDSVVLGVPARQVPR